MEDVSFTVQEGQTYGLMGESGCGKSTTGRIIAHLIPASGGQVLFDGVGILSMNQRAFRPYRRRIQILFQHPGAALAPHMTVLESLREPFLLHDLPDRDHMDEVIRAHIEPFGIQPELLERRTSQLSGGQIQRIVLARLMLLQPEFIVLDEPTSMLDVSVQAQVMELLRELQERTGVSYLLISHDLDLIRRCSHVIGIMQKGRIIEQNEPEALFAAPRQAYTQKLIRSFEYMKK